MITEDMARLLAKAWIGGRIQLSHHATYIDSIICQAELALEKGAIENGFLAPSADQIAGQMFTPSGGLVDASLERISNGTSRFYSLTDEGRRAFYTFIASEAEKL